VQPLRIIGLGLLGSALAERLTQHGCTCVGYDIDRQRCTAFAASGSELAGSVRDIAERCSTLVLSLPDSTAVEAVAEQLLPAARGQCVIDTTTGDPEVTAQVAGRLADHGLDYLDATIVGSSEMARRGQIVALVGGPSPSIARGTRVLDLLGQRWFHVGPPGSGARAKLIVNLVLGLNRAVLAEALAFARRAGLDPERMLEILRSGAAYSRVMDTKGLKMIQHEFTAEARLRQHHKDVKLILAEGQRCHARLPLSELHDQLLAAAEALGWGDADNSAIVMAFEDAP